MGSWRQRGFVPDSDDEDASIDSQGSRSEIRPGVDDAEGCAGSTPSVSSTVNGNPSGTTHFAVLVPIDACAPDKENDPITDDAGQGAAAHTKVDVEKQPGFGPQATQELDEIEEVESQIVAPPVFQSGDTTTLSPLPFVPDAERSSTPSAQPKDSVDIWDIPGSPASSVDELQAASTTLRKPTSTILRAAQTTNLSTPTDNDSLSPLSSIPPSPGSLKDLDVDLGGTAENRRPDTDASAHLEIPQEILDEINQPSRRNLRQRNPIQLHPYELEYARYHSLMKATGLKPVRLETFRHERDKFLEESQRKDSTAAAGPSSSPSAGFRDPPPSPAAHGTSARVTPRQNVKQAAGGSDPLRTADTERVAKRRKLSQYRGNHDRAGVDFTSRLQVFVDNTIPPEESQTGLSIFDFPPPSPPRSGTASSTHTVVRSGFRFPPGFSPPAPATPVIESKLNESDIVSSNAPNSPTPNAVGAESDAASGTSGNEHLSENGDGHNDDMEEIIVKRLQRKIKGVLPASWLRLDLKKQEQKRSAPNQRHRDLTSPKPDNARGVARKIIKKDHRVRPNAGRSLLPSLQPFIDDSDDDIDDANEALVKDRKDPNQALAELVGFDEDFSAYGSCDDAVEDNRIDYMFPSASPKQSTPRPDRQAMKRPLPAEYRRAVKPRKRMQVKRQTRITDSLRKGQVQERRPAKPRRAPRGILDAPDVADRPREEQPQFLRVAARNARLRRDGGRRAPAGKFLRLESRADTDDANKSLAEWRRRGIAHSEIAKPRSRAVTGQGANAPVSDEQDSFSAEDGLPVVLRDVSRQAARANLMTAETIVRDATSSPAKSNAGNEPQSSAAEHRQARRQAHRFVVRRNVAISSLRRTAFRPAAPDMGTVVGNQLPSLFNNSISSLNRNFRHSREAGQSARNMTLDRYLADSRLSWSQHCQRPVSEGLPGNDASTSCDSSKRACRLRKRAPQRLETHATTIPDWLAMAGDDSEVSTPQSAPRIDSSRQLPDGLCGLEKSYTVDFGIAPLPLGTFFHESTFIGSGEFARSLALSQRDMDEPGIITSMDLGCRTVRWGPWNDTVSSEFGTAMETLARDVEGVCLDSSDKIDELASRGDAMLRSILRYVTGVLTFIDPIDRSDFVKRGLLSISRFRNVLDDLLASEKCPRRLALASYCDLLVLAYQVYRVSSSSSVDRHLCTEALEVVQGLSRALLHYVLSRSMKAELSAFLQDIRLQDKRDKGIRGDFPVVESLVIVRHVLQTEPILKDLLEASIAESLSPLVTRSSGCTDIKKLEDAWHTLLVILPFFEIDHFGIARAGSRLKRTPQMWEVVKALVTPVLDSYGDSSSSAHPRLYNTYCRTLSQRCFHLIHTWGWRDCKLILEVFFDFFAKHSLYNLSAEESFGSPSFLDELDGEPSFDMGPNESCFCVFLRLVGCGLRYMSRTHEKKKLRNLAWRLLPNHGRVYPKEKPLLQEDLDALRNHHDLLSTLYWAVPDGCRPRLQAIRDLVNPASSHLETINISFRTWSRLVSFKLSTKEDICGLEPFAKWHGQFGAELLRQHALARSEVEAQGKADGFSRQEIDKVVAQNQRQIESLLSTALNGLRNAVQVAPEPAHARVLLSQLPIKPLLGLFNPKSARANNVVSEALQVVLTYVKKNAPTSSDDLSILYHAAPSAADEDSQEYGDWTDIEAIYAEPNPAPSEDIDFVDKTFRPAISRLVSNCFGDDHCAEDSFLFNLVDCWTSIAQVLVQHGLRHWDSYLSPFDGESWVTLRSTMQTRKFTPQFLASCIEKDPRFFADCKTQILRMWMASLVERASLLKFQHRLTEALLNRDSASPLLNNLPFSKDRKTGRYTISLEELSHRRLALISSLLSNMRDDLQNAEHAMFQGYSSTKAEYKDLLQQLMSSMKANYQELGDHAKSAHGAYVIFVHNVVGFLQQYTRDICPIDPYFTDPTSFPLPAMDPTYIVARLKSYEPRLASESVAKTLITFVQGVSERAAIDGQQTYLVDQLYASMAETYESGDPSKPTLRAFLLQCLFPAYLESMFSNAAAWILVQPMLQVISRVFRELLLNVDMTDPSCVSSVLCMFDSVFHASFQALSGVHELVQRLHDAPILLSLAAVLDMVTASLPVIDYIDRATDKADSVLVQIRTFREFAQWSLAQISDSISAEDDHFVTGHKHASVTFPTEDKSRMTPSPPSAPRYFSETRRLASRELKSYINESWSRHGDRYYFTRRGVQGPQAISLDASLAAKMDLSSAMEMLTEAVRAFLDSLDSLDMK